MKHNTTMMCRSALIAFAVLCSCSRNSPNAESVPVDGVQLQAASHTVDKDSTKAGDSKLDSTNKQFAYFAGGCFWGVEHYLERMDGVLSVESGYMGGKVKSPKYQDVLTKRSGHLEAVRVSYDPSRVSYQALAQRFFEIHDPTQADGQGPDKGPQYLSAVFYDSDTEKKATEGLIQKLYKRGFDVVTKLYPAVTFWPAEEYHQNYYVKTGKAPYCHRRIKRFDKPVVR